MGTLKTMIWKGAHVPRESGSIVNWCDAYVPHRCVPHYEFIINSYIISPYRYGRKAILLGRCRSITASDERFWPAILTPAQPRKPRKSPEMNVSDLLLALRYPVCCPTPPELRDRDILKKGLIFFWNFSTVEERVNSREGSQFFGRQIFLRPPIVTKFGMSKVEV